MAEGKNVLKIKKWKPMSKRPSSRIVDTLEQPPTLEGLKTCRHINTEDLVK
jgi:hypothetical protein